MDCSRRATKASTLGPNSALAPTQSRLATAMAPASACRRSSAAADSAARPSGTISPLLPSRTSSRLAGRSDSSGMQPCAIASSTETETESLRGTLTYQRARA